jgi:hypothetical protein
LIFTTRDSIGNPIVSEALPKIVEAKVPLAKIVRSDFSREQPVQVTFERLLKYHDRTPQIQIAVSSYSELITGTEMTVNTENEKAKTLIEEWIRSTNFYDKFESLVTTVLITGNGILEKLDENDVQDVLEVDMATIIAKKRDISGNLEYYEHRTQNGQTDKLGEGKLGKFIEFNLTNYSRQAWGKSLFYSLAIPRTVGNRTTAPLIEIMWGIEDAMGAIILNNAYPITTITYPGASDTYLEKEATRWQRYKPGDKRVQKIKPEIEFFETTGNSKYTDYITHIEKSFELGTQFPHDIMTGDFTSRASSETTDNIVMKRVRGYQRYLSNKLKTELFDSILIQNGFDPDEVDLTIGFTTQNVVELEVGQVKDLVDSGLLTKNEGREWFRENTGMELPDDEEIKANQDMANTVAMNAQDIKKEHINKFNLEEVKSVIPKKKRMCKMCKESQHSLCTKRGCQCQ